MFIASFYVYIIPLVKLKFLNNSVAYAYNDNSFDRWRKTVASIEIEVLSRVDVAIERVYCCVTMPAVVQCRSSAILEIQARCALVAGVAVEWDARLDRFQFLRETSRWMNAINCGNVEYNIRLNVKCVNER